MATVLTKTSAELNVNIQANGKGNFSVNSGGRTIGDSSDIQKIQSLGSFINDERKAIVKTSVTAIAKKTIAAIVLVSRDNAFADQVPRPITRIDKSFVDVFRTVSAQAEMLNANLQQITQTEANGGANELVRNHLIETGARIREALGMYLLYRGGIAEADEPRKLNSFLEGNDVLSWVFNRLSSQKLQLGSRDFEYRKIYFPKDPTKGIQVTLKELKTDSILQNQGGILVNMSVYRGLWSDESIRAICGVPDDWDLNTFEGPSKVLSNVPIMVVPFPHAVLVEEHLTILAQNGDRGLPWNVGNTITPQDTMKFLGTVPKRISYGFLGRPRYVAPWFETFFTGFVFDRSVIEKEGRSVFSQLLSQFRAGTIQSNFFADVRGESGYARARAVIPPLVLAVMDMPADNDLARNTVRVLSTGMLAIGGGEIAARTDAWAAFISRRDMDDNRCNEILNGILSVNLEQRSKGVKPGDIRSARSQLSPQGALLLREFRRRGYITLSTRVDQWMRSFLTSELQGAVAEIVSARLEASLATPIQYGRGDTAVYLEPAEFAGDEDVPEDDEEVPAVAEPE